MKWCVARALPYFRVDKDDLKCVAGKLQGVMKVVVMLWVLCLGVCRLLGSPCNRNNSE